MSDRFISQLSSIFPLLKESSLLITDNSSFGSNVFSISTCLCYLNKVLPIKVGPSNDLFIKSDTWGLDGTLAYDLEVFKGSYRYNY